MNTITEIPIISISKNKNQPRLDFVEKEIEKLALSIKKFGIIQPITIRKNLKNKYELISGERRMRACEMLGMKTITSFVKNANDNESLEMALIENIQRENLNPIEIALSFKQLINISKLTQEELGRNIGKSRTLVTNYLRLLNLPHDIQKALIDNKISIGHAKPLIIIEEKQNQINIFNDIIRLKLSVRETEELCKIFRNIPYNESKTKKQNIDINYINIKNLINDLVKSRTNISVNKKGNGKITIYFNNLEGLRNIWDKIK